MEIISYEPCTYESVDDESQSYIISRKFTGIRIQEVKDYQTRCRPSKGRRCVPDVVLKNDGSMMQTCNINVHVVNTDIRWD